MARMQGVTMLIYEEDKKLIEALTLNHRDIETGGDLFGLWQSESEVVVQVVTGPGRNCRRTTTSFFQDKTYLTDVGNYLTSAKGLCNIGEWHSHHSLNLPEPSEGDRGTVWRNMPGYGLKRFLLIIATIKRDGNPEMNGFMFTSLEHGNQQMIHVRCRILSGPNPFRNQPDVLAKLHDGAESPRVMAAPEEDGRMTIKERKDQKKVDKRDRKKIAKEEKKKRKQQKKAEKQRKKKEEEEKNRMKDNKRRFGKKFRGNRRNSYDQLQANGETSETIPHDSQSHSLLQDQTTPNHWEMRYLNDGASSSRPQTYL